MSKLSNILSARSSQGPSDNFKNLIINGAMQVAQRGTSVTSITSFAYYTADRWFNGLVGLGTWTETIENDAPTGSGFRKSLKLLCTTADASPNAADVLRIEQRIEGQNLQSIKKGTSNAEQLTLSFWVKANVTGTYVIELRDIDNARSVSAAYTISASATWEKKTIIFPADTTGAFDNDNANSFTILWFIGAGSNLTSGTLNTTWASRTLANVAVGQTNLAAATNNYWQVTGVQLEVGAVATPFEFKPFDTELAQCQRYYYQTIPLANKIFTVGQAYSTIAAFAPFQFPTTMRNTPSVAFSAAGDFDVFGATGGRLAVTSAGANAINVDNFRFDVSVASGLVVGNATVYIDDSAGNAIIKVSAEL